MIQLPAAFDANRDLTRGFRVTHDLGDHRLLSRSAIQELGFRLPPNSAELGESGLVAPGGLDFEAIPRVDAGQALADLEGKHQSVYLHNIEQDPEMAALVLEVLGDIIPKLALDMASVLTQEGYLFLTGGAAITSAHVDHEYNFLLVLRGHKRVFIADVPSMEAELALERMYSGGYGMCDHIPSSGTEHSIGPGEGVFIPPRGAHYVINGDEPCAALSVVFRTPELVEQAAVYALNAKLRRLGLSPKPLGQRTRTDLVKARAMTTLQRSVATIRARQGNTADTCLAGG